MVSHFAECSHTAGSWTGILALAALAGLVPGTVRVEHALGAATHVGISLELRQTRALSSLAHSVGTARRGITGIAKDRSWRRRRWPAADEGIALIARRTTADGRVVDDIAHGLEATRTGTGIATLLADARQVRGTVRVYDALWLAVGRSSEVARQAGTHCLLALSPTLAKGAARRGSTGIAVGFLGGIVSNLRSCKGFGVRRTSRGAWVYPSLTYALAATDGITLVARQAAAVRTVVDGPTLGIAAAGTGTRIHAVVLDTSQGKGALARDGALGPTARWGSYKLRQAGAYSLAVRLPTLGVGATGRGLTGSRGYGFRQGCRGE